MKSLHLFRHVRKEWVIVLLAAVVVFLAGAAVVSSLLRPEVTLRLGDGIFVTRVARTSDELTRGLSGTSPLGENEAMLFVFDHPSRWAIWMKDMSYPIDVVWLNDQKQVVYSVSNMTPDSYPTTFAPRDPASYVVELPAGTIQRKAIGPATVAEFQLSEGR